MTLVWRKQAISAFLLHNQKIHLDISMDCKFRVGWATNLWTAVVRDFSRISRGGAFCFHKKLHYISEMGEN
jgi:hypothetical protein